MRIDKSKTTETITVCAKCLLEVADRNSGVDSYHYCHKCGKNDLTGDLETKEALKVTKIYYIIE